MTSDFDRVVQLTNLILQAVGTVAAVLALRQARGRQTPAKQRKPAKRRKYANRKR